MEDQKRDDDWSAVRRQVSGRIYRTGSTGSFDGRLWIAVTIFLAVALVYPWYSYQVNAFLLARDMEVAAREFARVSEESVRELQKQVAQSADASRREQRRRRIGSVKIKGVSDGPHGPVVIVEMGDASLNESQETICRQASLWLKMKLTNTTLTVQRYRMNQPALDLGIVTCR
ncbi:hypothetical protein [Dokdonella immobilis]|uniref:Uncharacterized protein n=1 Tax=Dokdonella immobilis TaxID=578942 RepID=A0A1I5A7S5_9GAMM|nr:hypothetical protein [Dokdonella immobilis]SFN58418.1 hypothetical protein SAMN05216289_13325 [Dokdonella immobilis]